MYTELLDYTQHLRIRIIEMNKRERMVRVERIVSELSGTVPPGKAAWGGALFLCIELIAS